MIEDFSIQFSPFYLFMKYLAIISRHPIYVYKCIKELHFRRNLKSTQESLCSNFFTQFFLPNLKIVVKIRDAPNTLETIRYPILSGFLLSDRITEYH